MTMINYDELKDIPCYDTWISIEPINQGFSTDRKFCITDINCEKFFLRLSDATSYARKKQEHEIIRSMSCLEVPTVKDVYLGLCNSEKHTYMLQTWIDGEILENVLPTFSKTKQYELGLEAGRLLKKIHSLQPKASFDWYSTRFNQYLSNYDNYKKHGLSYEYEQQIDRYIKTNIHLLKGKQISLVHGDFHVGNMILSPADDLYIIDFDRFDWKNPIEDFYKLAVFSRNVSTPFSIGQIDGYTDFNPSIEFWELYALSVAMTSFLSLLWGKRISETMYKYRKRLCDILVEDHDCFKNRIPNWYKK